MATLKGIWVFNEQLPRDYAPLVENEFYNMNFTSNGVNFTSIHVTDIDADEDFVTQLWYDYTPVADGYLSSYMTFVDANYRTIVFGSTEQTVDDTFYTWLTENATQQATEEDTTTSGVTVEYNGSVVATVEGGNTATLPIKDLKMKSDIVITVPEAEGGGTDSAIPIEVATEAEMTALLTSGEVGGVYKYVGETTDAYENGALYVLEEEEESIVGTWKLNDTLTVPTAFSDVSVTGTCYAFNYSQEIDSFDIGTVSATAGTSFKIQTSSIAYNIYYVAGDARCRDDGDESSINVPTDDTRMTQLRTITITEEPTDETFIAWLKANATKQ